MAKKYAERYRKAKSAYADMFDEKGALLSAGFKPSELKAAMADESWRSYIRVLRAERFGHALQTLSELADDVGTADTVRARIAAMLANEFHPGTQDDVEGPDNSIAGYDDNGVWE